MRARVAASDAIAAAPRGSKYCILPRLESCDQFFQVASNRRHERSEDRAGLCGARESRTLHCVSLQEARFDRFAGRTKHSFQSAEFALRFPSIFQPALSGSDKIISATTEENAE